jgi:cyanobactin maturation PatA/PatG family protease
MAEQDTMPATPAAAPRADADPAPALGDGLVYALGQIGYDYPSRSRRASLQQRMEDGDPDDPASLLAHLDANPYDASAVHWVLNLDGAPLYFLEPTGPFASETYELLRGFLREHIQEGVERVSVPGIVAGTAPHRSGVELPVVVPFLSGMYSWTTKALVASVADAAGKSSGKAKANLAESVSGFLDRVYFELRNLGREPHERALNFAATNAFEVARVYEQAIADAAELDTIEVEPSTVAPPGGNCWDVKLVFFYPEREPQAVRRVYRFTVDVADVVPATVGPMRSWSIR